MTRRKPGPKPRPGFTRYGVYLDAETERTLRDYGDGNLSAGVRRAAKLVAEVLPSLPDPSVTFACPECGQTGHCIRSIEGQQDGPTIFELECAQCGIGDRGALDSRRIAKWREK